ncbi:acetyl/propionyl/methylcrotonyl-CoA carboxylase subunit alpha [Sphingosinicella sp. BN140058]|uniref:acetyl/propionyl/methylcrotonyl-CoA carboxylase subunit alpha n=1 Tax=Sphingosinicella sp. BN140058 TaxID=1892855 RepID=UPI001010FE28|nr:acetyl/propionyl/methylcrotonyl-CoA carboxylase subunit alpha [Sphingosinicella sp. BN140058]QAY75173.1 acetyl/propionyl/methylcrotonyl-CoA carboxylase subunit alpha [Sphingosinicella sp. BN140058]
MIRSLLIANRGEIACRVIRTARRLGIRTIAVFSDADRHALHVREADTAVHIGPSPARESYLVGDRILAAARETGAEAIHPGYGFLSENADFAQKVIDAGLVWVGPKPASIRAMGLKDAAKRLMDAAGVPTTPGYLGDDQSPDRLKSEADAINYPVLIKAVAGGGGKGMRRVNQSQEFADMLASCKREAAASFGDDRVLIEKYIERPRHIEVQVFGDSHGNVVHLFERDCSLQRRHQKVIEEAPAPGMDAATREAVCGAAVKAAKAVDYVGAGTIEFIADASEGLRPDRIWFMEMNTRLQVEHPVTEEITGQDLVEWQLRVASGERLPLRQEELRIRGHAMEARLYAEDPAHEFLPSTGRLDHFVLGRGLRVDTGVEEGDRISPYYDPMIAKLIAHASTRDEAIDRLVDTLEQLEIWPVKTNAAFLARAADHTDFRNGDVDTAFIPSRIDRLVPDSNPGEPVWNLAATALLASDFGSGGEGEPWDALQGFRLNAAPDLSVAIAHGGETRLVDAGGDPPIEGIATAQGENVLVFASGQAFAFTLPGVGGAAGGGAAGDGSLVSPMPGRVLSVDTRQGDRVAKGQKLVTLEAMKMEHSLVAPFDGIVAELQVAEGEQVTEGALLVRVEKDEA